MAKKRVSDRNTKAEILAAYEELQAREQELQQQLKQAQDTPNAKAPANPGGQAETTSPSPSPVASPAIQGSTLQSPIGQDPVTYGYGMTDILQGLEQLQIGFGGAVSRLSEALLQEATQLQELQTSVEEEQQQLETLHELVVDETDLDQLIEQYKHDFKAFQQELENRQEQWERSLTDAEQAWEKEQEDYRRQAQEQRQQRDKEQQRDRADYEYRIALEQQLSQETFEQEENQLFQALAEAKRTQQKAWTAQEQEIAAQEEEFATIKAKAEALPEEQATAVKRAREEGKGIAQQQAKVRADLVEKDLEGQKRVHELRLQSLQETLSNQNHRIQTLSQQLNAALQQVQDLAVKAIEGTANASSLQAMKEIALEQAKTQSKGK